MADTVLPNAAACPSRRGFIRGAGAATFVGALGLPAVGAVAQDPATPDIGPLRSGETLPDPDFSRLRAVKPFVVGVRPYREGGVCLKLEDAALDSPTGPKQLIHNYGHGGAGITLSWGCASVVVELVATATQRLAAIHKRPAVAVLGTGVIGLTVASELRRKWPHLPITVYAGDLDVAATTSFKAAGQFEPSGIDGDYQTPEKKSELRDFLRRSRARMRTLQNARQGPRYGIAERKNYTLDIESPGFDLATGRNADQSCDVICPARTGLLPFARLNGPGREFDTWLINPTILLPRLVSELKERAVLFRRKRFNELADVAALEETIIVNCTGYGAKALFGDALVHAKRGHLVMLQRRHPRHFYFFSGGCRQTVTSYVFCRQHDIVLGGTAQLDHDSEELTEADTVEFQRIIDKAKALFDGDIARCIALNTFAT